MTNSTFSNFESETTATFTEDLILNGYGLIAIALENIIDDAENADIISCEEALLSSEIIAAATGNAAHDFPGDLLEWMHTHIPQGSAEHANLLEMREKAADAIDNIVTNSELRELWEDTNSFSEWFDAQVALQKRILE